MAEKSGLCPTSGADEGLAWEIMLAGGSRWASWGRSSKSRPILLVIVAGLPVPFPKVTLRRDCIRLLYAYTVVVIDWGLTRKQIVYLINYSRIFSSRQKQEVKGFLNTVTLLPALHENELKGCGEPKTVFESTEKQARAILEKGNFSKVCLCLRIKYKRFVHNSVLFVLLSLRF